MPEPVIIRAEPATLQVRTAAQAAGKPSDHALVIGEEDRGGVTELHFSCSCGGFSGSHHTDRGHIEAIHAAHVAKKVGDG